MPRGHRIGALFGALGALAVSSCGLVYTSPEVAEGGFFGNDTALDVDIVPLTYETTLAANMMPNIPARLPLGMQPGAGLDAAATPVSMPGMVSVGMPSMAPIPAPPSQPGARPGFIPDRLPPPSPPIPYAIGVADVLLLSVNTAGATIEQLPSIISAQSQRQGFVVQDDGAIAIPDAGRVRVAGLTMQEAEAAIFQTLVSAGVDPSFSLEIAEFNSQRVAVGGEVRSPMLVPISLKPLYLNEAISAAGGLSVVDPSYARIILTRDGEIYQIGAERFINDPAARQILLREGDSIYVESEFQEERARARFQEQLAIRGEQQSQAQFAFQMQQAQAQFALQLQQAQAQLLAQQQTNALGRAAAERELFLSRVELGAVERGYAYLAGEVGTPQRFALPFENSASLADVLFQQGSRGINIQYGDYSEIYVLRRPTNPEEAGTVLAFHLDADNAANLTLASMFDVHPGDIVFVAEQPITAWNRVISQALPNLFASLASTVASF